MATTISNASSARWVCASSRFAAAILALAILAGCARATSDSSRKSPKKIWEDYSGDKALAHVQAMVAFTDTDGLFGSRYFAKQLAAENKAKQFRGGILLDMVGDKSLTITLPPDSPPELALGIFASAEALNVRKNFTYFDRDIIDDHTPLNEIGIPVIDLIDFDY